ncbi:auxin-responsive protein IAA25-like isoform X2 [Phragmites australis]|uniref:auxin-responsive protein IAA25-like isoform X2 n=1 Tax=Phragmites australis TaxID=29695 RepID=UPI002D77CB99|nr:auxin-responsive protein IAA25-like isoform X2 [Phragmites australis]
MKSSSVAPSLKLKQEQVGDESKLQGSGLNCLELRLGISSDNDSSPWLGVGVDPWSLAARQEKAALEQAHQMPDYECALQRDNRAAAPPQLVGWPPVRAFRKNLVGAKPADAAEDLVKVKHGSDDGLGAGERPPTTMFVKVNLEGCAVGRKVDLQAHRGYGSLSRALQSMFHGFLSDGQWRIAAKDDDDEQQQQLETNKGPKKTFILLYEDSEGDRMLVGDVPWELFIASVKRLYIAQDRP